MAEYYRVRQKWECDPIDKDTHDGEEGKATSTDIITKLDNNMVMKIFDCFSIKRVNGFMRLSKRMRIIAKMNKKSRGSEWGVVRRYNIYAKPTELTWPEFQNQLDSFHIEITLPTQWGETGGFVIKPGRRKTDWETSDQHERSEAKRIEAGRRLGALPAKMAAPAKVGELKIPSKSSIASVSVRVHDTETKEQKKQAAADAMDDGETAVDKAARLARGQATCDALTKAILAMGPPTPDNGNETPEVGYEDAIRIRHAREESQTYEYLHRGDNVKIGHWITEPIVVCTAGTPVNADNQLSHQQWYSDRNSSPWRWGADVVASCLGSAASLVYGGSKLSCIGDLSSRYGTILTATLLLPSNKPLVQAHTLFEKQAAAQRARVAFFDDDDVYRGIYYDARGKQWKLRHNALKPVGTIKLMPPKPHVLPSDTPASIYANEKAKQDKEKAAADKKAAAALPPPPARYIYGYHKGIDHQLLTNYEVMQVMSDDHSHRRRAQAALLVNELAGLVNKPIKPLPPPTYPWQLPLHGPDLRAYNRVFRCTLPSYSYSSFINRHIQQQVHREFDADTGDRNILRGSLTTAIQHQSNTYSWGQKGDEQGTPLEQTWNDYHYNQQVVIRAPLAESTREANAIRDRSSSQWDSLIPLAHRRVMRVHLLTWVFHLYDAVRQLCISLCPEFHKKKAMKKMWVMGPDGQLMTSNVPQRMESNLKGETFQERPLEQHIIDLRGWVQSSETLRLLAAFLPIYDISKERDFNTFTKNVSSSDPRWLDLYSTCPCCYGW